MPISNYIEASARHDRPRILCVDDDAGVLASIERRLRPDRSRWNLVFVVGGQRALDAISGRSFDLVVTDYRMPGIDGFEVVAAARAACSSSAAVMLTSDAERIASWPAAAMLHRLLQKPCRTAELREAIESGLAFAALRSSIVRAQSATRAAATDNHSTLEQT